MLDQQHRTNGIQPFISVEQPYPITHLSRIARTYRGGVFQMYGGAFPSGAGELEAVCRW